MISPRAWPRSGSAGRRASPATEGRVARRDETRRRGRLHPAPAARGGTRRRGCRDRSSDRPGTDRRESCPPGPARGCPCPAPGRSGHGAPVASAQLDPRSSARHLAGAAGLPDRPARDRAGGRRSTQHPHAAAGRRDPVAVGDGPAPLLRRLFPPGSRGAGVRAALLALARRIPGRGGAGRLVPPLADAWLELAGRRALAPVAASLHAAAAAFALGAIGALYLDGLGTEYHAYWESTFLGPDAVTTLVTVLLGPVSLLGGPALPDAGTMAAMADQSIPAARWIHLWALALLFWAVLPRTLLALWQTRRARQPLAFPDQDAWLQRSLAARAGTALQIRVQPLGYCSRARGSWRS
ncbi:MAG: DUF2868 domain-containing protein [Gammaproteobacteria bacterium]|nr:DUF2868 domain-containing protein [Gammaproteobacteria bacterium]